MRPGEREGIRLDPGRERESDYIRGKRGNQITSGDGGNPLDLAVATDAELFDEAK